MNETLTPTPTEKKTAYEHYQKDIQALSKAADMLLDMSVSVPARESIYDQLITTEKAIAEGDDSEETKDLRHSLERAHLALDETEGDPAAAAKYLEAQAENNRRIARLVQPAEPDNHETPNV